jgi:hypothetical protein
MKWILLSLVGLVLIFAIVIGGGLGWFLNMKTDVKDPAFAAKFQKNMEGFCVQNAKNIVASSGRPLDYQEEALMKQVCSCHMKETMKILAKKGAKTPAEIQAAYSDSRPLVEAAFESCALSYGLQ